MRVALILYDYHIFIVMIQFEHNPFSIIIFQLPLSSRSFGFSFPAPPGLFGFILVPAAVAMGAIFKVENALFAVLPGNFGRGMFVAVVTGICGEIPGVGMAGEAVRGMVAVETKITLVRKSRRLPGVVLVALVAGFYLAMQRIPRFVLLVAGGAIVFVPGQNMAMLERNRSPALDRMAGEAVLRHAQVQRVIWPLPAMAGGAGVPQRIGQQAVGKSPGSVAGFQTSMVGVAPRAVAVRQRLVEDGLLRDLRNGVAGNRCHPDLIRRMAGYTFAGGWPCEGSVAGKAVVANVPVAFDQRPGHDQRRRIAEHQKEQESRGEYMGNMGFHAAYFQVQKNRMERI